MKNPDLQKCTMNLFKGDYAKLQELYPDTGAATIIRRIIRGFIEQIEKTGEKAPSEIDINL